MYASSSSSSYHYSNTRYNTFHGPKQRVLGNQAGNVAPAWRYGNNSGYGGARGQGLGGAQGLRRQQTSGSKILLTQLPLDVGDKEVEELFIKTVGPLKESFIIYNNQGRSKGMAVVMFQRPGDAVIAREKYNGKFIDGRRPIRIELVSDTPAIPTGPSIPTSASQNAAPASYTPSAPNTLNTRHPRAPPRAPAPTPAPPMSLIDRISKLTGEAPTMNNRKQNQNQPKQPSYPNHQLLRQAAAAASIAKSTQNTSPHVSSHVTLTSAPAPAQKRRTKKGPRRLKKMNVQFPRFTSNGHPSTATGSIGNVKSGHVQKQAKTLEQLDQDMEEYRAEAEADFEGEFEEY
ncbi:hypothetical protein J3R30DRAFT_762938 [Lentinula aciculospora]|uniref:RRM domain-containing protein n=1 Tax=Lentinula aciculospora TaxID=153920 RepID=A0A9W9DJ51_9AGAR|nr:hypothetical protein J3R30DRAFT_762938 [Lentinula aciculospora]